MPLIVPLSVHMFDHSPDRREYEAGQVVFQAGEPGDCMYVVVEGEVDVLVNGQRVETAGPGTVIGEMALIDKSPRSATAQTRSPSTLVPVGEREFLFLVHEHPTFALTTMRFLAERIRQMNAANAAPPT
jgi:CRP-like cAMP-binding protein